MYNVSTTTSREQYIDQGLKNFMISVYNNMCFALLISGLVAFGIAASPEAASLIWKTHLKWIALLSPLVLSIGLLFFVDKLSSSSLRLFLYLFAGVMGVSISIFFIVFKLGSVFQAFFITAAMFGTMTLYGYTTNRDLSGFGSFLIMGLIGVIIAGLVNLFLQSSMLAFIVSCVSVLVFTGLTAYETQQIKDSYNITDEEERAKIGVLGALNLYMNFINIFINLLQLIGEKNE